MKLATLLYAQKDDKTLMLYRNKKENDYHKGKWNGLGGKFELGESPEDCAIRELKEESGLDAKKLNLKGHLTFPMFDGKDDWYVFVFTIPEFEGELIESNEGHLEWIENSELHKLNLWEGDKHFIDWLFQDEFFSAKFNYKNGVFIDYSVTFY
ncbi:MAG: DNA mismatch repair protein MutT [Ignavibacteriales bacterium CG18_big_fil_WC_8_21_14_2_50_31_20]|nr:MAG: DNA mismatch repair protein MutT [Ignavibacteriales bacterium CG18_big_fil_WC_8_21_14_2_50_31_20]